jgi:hypothetical protein
MNECKYVCKGDIPFPKRYLGVLKKLREYPFKVKGDVTPFSYVHTLLCSTYHVNKRGGYEILYEMEKRGHVEVISCVGVRVRGIGRSADSVGD